MSRLLILFVALMHLDVFCATFNATVTRVIDGDTLIVHTTPKERQKIRLFGIDAPELRQRDGAKPGRYLMIRISGKPVTIVPTGTDTYGRTLAVVYDEFGTNMNQELVRLGLAWVYRKYSKNPDWLALESQARSQGIGIWRRKNPTPPWVYRNNKYRSKQKK